VGERDFHRGSRSALRAASIEPPFGWTTLEIASRTASGRAQRLKLLGGKPPTSIVSASSLRFAVDRALGWKTIRSNLYEIRSAGAGLFSPAAVQATESDSARRALKKWAVKTRVIAKYSASIIPARNFDRRKRSSGRNALLSVFDLVSADAGPDSFILPIAERLLKVGEESLGWRLPYRAEIRVFPTIDLYRNTTGEPGWVAASTRGHTIRLQPVKEFSKKGIIESTLRHELYHLLNRNTGKDEHYTLVSRRIGSRSDGIKIAGCVWTGDDRCRNGSRSAAIERSRGNGKGLCLRSKPRVFSDWEVRKANRARVAARGCSQRSTRRFVARGPIAPAVNTSSSTQITRGDRPA